MSVMRPNLNRLRKPVFERGDRIGQAVGREHDLPVGPVQGVERVEELLLQTFLAFHELDVVDEEHVDVAIAPLEHGRRMLVRIASTNSFRNVSVDT